jgi:hypothetical protein
MVTWSRGVFTQGMRMRLQTPLFQLSPRRLQRPAGSDALSPGVPLCSTVLLLLKWVLFSALLSHFCMTVTLYSQSV